MTKHGDRRLRRRLVVPAALAAAALAGQMAGGTYTVKKGDTLWSLSRSHGTTVDALATANDIADPDLILIGQELDLTPTGEEPPPVPAPAPANNEPTAPANEDPAPTTTAAPERDDKPKPEAEAKPTPKPTPEAKPKPKPKPDTESPPAPAPSVAGGSHTVEAGDTLWSIAAENNTSVDVLQDVNGLGDDSVQPGQVIQLPSNGPAPEPAAAPSSGSASTPSAGPTVVTIYRVQPGDTATNIAVRYSISVEALLQANQLSSAGDIEVGAYVRIPLAQ